MVLQETGIEYCLEKKGPEVTLLLFMDVLKLLAKNKIVIIIIIILYIILLLQGFGFTVL